MTSSETLAARAARLHARSEQLRETTARRRQALERARDHLAAVEGTASSDDGLVTATVDTDGVLTRLELSPKVRGSNPHALAHVITGGVRRAAADARNRKRAVYESLRAEGAVSKVPEMPSPDVGGPLTLSSTTPVHPTTVPARSPRPDRRPPRISNSDHDDGPPSSWLLRAT